MFLHSKSLERKNVFVHAREERRDQRHQEITWKQMEIKAEPEETSSDLSKQGFFQTMCVWACLSQQVCRDFRPKIGLGYTDSMNTDKSYQILNI